jgi:hypothetical protein
MMARFSAPRVLLADGRSALTDHGLIPLRFGFISAASSLFSDYLGIMAVESEKVNIGLMLLR